MKNIVCPISEERIPEHLPRVTAFINISIMGAYLYSQSEFILIFLIFDFLIRGFNFPQYSIINFLSRKLSIMLKLKSPKIDKAPKLFAARLGGFMFIAALSLNLAGAFFSTGIIVIMVAVLATIECVFNFCVGCYIYSYFVLPFYSK